MSKLTKLSLGLSAFCLLSLNMINVQAADDLRFNNHKLAVSSGEFMGNIICSMDLDDQHPKEFQVVAEKLNNASYNDFKNMFKSLKGKGCQAYFVDSDDNLHSDPAPTANEIYGVKAICFNGNGSIKGVYDTKKGIYRYNFAYGFSEGEIEAFRKEGLIDFMEKKLRRNCDFL